MPGYRNVFQIMVLIKLYNFDLYLYSHQIDRLLFFMWFGSMYINIRGENNRSCRDSTTLHLYFSVFGSFLYLWDNRHSNLFTPELIRSKQLLLLCVNEQMVITIS